MSNLAYIDDTKKWTYKNIQKLKDENRYEIINGKLYMLASPSTIHQRISWEMSIQIGNYLKGKTCQPFYAPMDVDIECKGDEATILLQPDIFVVCNKNKQGKNTIIGPPDFAIEILSPSSSKKDEKEKFALYERYKVREYWIVNPIEKEVQLYVLEDNKYINKGIHSFKSAIRSNIFEGLTIDLKDIYDDKSMYLREEVEKYENIEAKTEEAIRKYVDYKLGKYEKQVLQHILSLKDTWDYEDDVMELGAFRKLFELFDGELVYRGNHIIHFR